MGDQATGPSPLRSKSILIDMISGGVGGLSVVLVGYPFDLVKTRLQTSVRPAITASQGGSSESLRTMRQIWHTQGWRGFYQGATAPLIGVTPIFAANFYGYELGKRIYDQCVRTPLGGQQGPDLGRCAVGALYSALQTAVIVIPAERVKVFMQMARPVGDPITKMGAIQTTVHLFRIGGLGELYRGATATLMRDVPGLMAFFTSYEVYRSWLCPSMTIRHTRNLREMGGVMVAGGLAGITSWMVSLPSDVLKSRLQAQTGSQATAGVRFPMLKMARALIREGGVAALYKGLVPVLLRAFPANAACFLGYEACKSVLHHI